MGKRRKLVNSNKVCQVSYSLLLQMAHLKSRVATHRDLYLQVIQTVEEKDFSFRSLRYPYHVLYIVTWRDQVEHPSWIKDFLSPRLLQVLAIKDKNPIETKESVKNIL